MQERKELNESTKQILPGSGDAKPCQSINSSLNTDRDTQEGLESEKETGNSSKLGRGSHPSIGILRRPSPGGFQNPAPEWLYGEVTHIRGQLKRTIKEIEDLKKLIEHLHGELEQARKQRERDDQGIEDDG